jgi:acetyl esterase/lipase
VVYVERNRPLTLQIISQANAGEKNPALVFVQGSGWQPQKIKLYMPKLMAFARAGYVVVCVEYRCSEEAGYPAQIQDTRTAVRYVKAHAKELGVDPERIALMGDSSGGHTALMAGLTDAENLDTPEYGEYSADVAAVIDYYAPTDMSQMFDFSGEGEIPAEIRERMLLFRHAKTYEEAQEMLKLSNPLRYITPSRPLPPVCRSAIRTVPEGAPCFASSLASVLVESTQSRQIRFCPQG